MDQMVSDKRKILIDEARDLLARMQDGDMEAFSRLYEVMCPDVMRTITRTGVKDADVEDIMQDVFIDVVNSCRSCREPQAAVKWINRIAFNKSVDFIRKNYREVLVTEGDEETFEESDLVAPIAMPENIAESKEIQRLVNDILCKLPPVQLAIVRAYYFNEMKVHDIAEQMKMPEGTVKTYLYKSRKYIETEVKALEKNHGMRLYSVSALPILYWLFALDADACVVPKETSASVFASTTKAMGQAGEQMAVKGTATTTSSFLKTALAGSVVKKVAIGVAAVVLIGGVAVLGSKTSSNKNNGQTATVNQKTQTDSVSNTFVRKKLAEYYKNNLVKKYGIADKEIKTLLTRGEEMPLDKIQGLDSKEGIFNTILVDTDDDKLDELLVVTFNATIEDYADKKRTNTSLVEYTNDEFYYGRTDFTVWVYKYNQEEKRVVELTNGKIQGPRIGQPAGSDYTIQCAYRKEPYGFGIYFTCCYSLQPFEGEHDIAWTKAFILDSTGVQEIVKDPVACKKIFSNIDIQPIGERLQVEDWEGLSSITDAWRKVMSAMEENPNYRWSDIKASEYATSCPFLNPFSVVDSSYKDVFTFKLVRDNEAPGYGDPSEIEAGQNDYIIFGLDTYNTTDLDKVK